MHHEGRQYVVRAGIALLVITCSGVPLIHENTRPSFVRQVADAVHRSVYLGRASVEGDAVNRFLQPGRPIHTPTEDLLWLARCIYSETKRPVEQLLVAWVIRNRVETWYRGKDSYKEVVLDPYQFSAFNTGSDLVEMDLETEAIGWKQTIHIARYVMHAPPSERPFSIITRHFYSERSMPGGHPPQWVRGVGVRPVTVGGHDIDESRFRFYSGIL